MTEEQLREYWIQYAEGYCNNTFDRNNLPGVVLLFIDIKVKQYRDNPAVQSESLSDMSQTYFENGASETELSILSPVRKLRTPTCL